MTDTARRLTRTSLAITFGLLSCLVSPRYSAAQSVIPTHEEPRHRPVLETSSLRVLDVTIAPEDTTLFHVHTLPAAFALIHGTWNQSQTMGGTWDPPIDPADFPDGSIWLDESYREEPLTHRIANLGSEPLRLIAVLNRGPGEVSGSFPLRGVPLEAEVSGPWFRGGRLSLAPESALEWDAHSRPVLLVQLFDQGMRVEDSEGRTSQTQDPGDIVLLSEGVDYSLTSSSPEEAVVGLIEVR